MQKTIDNEFIKEFESVKAIVSEYLSKCEDCRNDGNHLVRHIWVFYPSFNPETIRRTRQKIQNDYGLFLANKETQYRRQAKEKFMRDNIKNL